MKSTLKSACIAFGFIAFIASCRPSPQKEPPETPSEVLNEFVRSAPVQFINLDEVETQIIELSEENIIYSIYQAKENEPLLGFINSAVRVDDLFFVYDFTTKSIFEINNVGEIRGPLTREGSGPGEHNSSGKLIANSSFIYAADANNGRINRYTHNVEIAGALSDYLPGETDLNDDKILVTNRNSAGFVSIKPEEGLIAVSSLENLKDTLTTIMPRIIPTGYQPQVYNSVKFSINHNNSIAATYSPLPWYFIFDADYNLIQTLVLEYSTFDSLNIPAMEFFKPKGSEGFGGQKPVNNFRILDNENFIIGLREELVHLKLESDGSYQAVKIKFKHPFPVDPNSWTWVFNEVFSKFGDTLFLRNPEYLFKIKLEK